MNSRFTSTCVSDTVLQRSAWCLCRKTCIVRNIGGTNELYVKTYFILHLFSLGFNTANNCIANVTQMSTVEFAESAISIFAPVQNSWVGLHHYGVKTIFLPKTWFTNACPNYQFHHLWPSLSKRSKVWKQERRHFWKGKDRGRVTIYSGRQNIFYAKIKGF